MYFEKEWLKDAAKIALWNHWHNDGPRRTNHAEGYNNGLKTQLPHAHPRLAAFLVKIQEIHISIALRRVHLGRGYPPNEPARRYVENNAHIAAAKADLELRVISVDAADPNYPGYWDMLVLAFLDRVHHYI